MWYALLGFLFVSSALGILYLIRRIRRFFFIEKLAEKSNALAWAVSALSVASFGLFAVINVTAAIIVILHLLIFFLLCDLAALFYRIIKKKKLSINVRNFTALALATVYLFIGWINAHHISETKYEITSDKKIDLRIALIADTHFGVTLDGEGFAKQLEKIEKQYPDIIVIAGDFVDDDTSKEDMQKACAALSEVKTTYGVFFAFGNHDLGYYSYRNFSGDELQSELISNGVTILADESVLVNDSFYIIGRRDAYMQRKTMEELVAECDMSKYIIVIDHEPNDYAAEAASGVDIVLSGHTHGGHIFPAGQLGMLFGANDNLYGYERRGNTDFIVTSGMSGWAIPFKTGCFSEYVLIDATER